MTAAAETIPERKGAGSAPPAPYGSNSAVRIALLLSLPFLVVGVGGAFLASLQLAEPDVLGGSVSYGRLLPVATSALVYGWLALSLLAAALHILPRLLGVPLARSGLAFMGILLLAGSTAVGIGAVATGGSAGGFWREMPAHADWPLAGALFLLAYSLTSTARRRDGAVPVAAWYLAAGPWWLFATYVVGAVPGTDGVAAALQSQFTVTGITLGLASLGIGAGYYMVGRLAPDGLHPAMGRIGFWSLGFAWLWTAGRALQYGPTPDWAETVPVLFTAGMLVAVITVVADFGYALRSRSWRLEGEGSARLFVSGLALFAMVPMHMFMTSLRGPSSVVRFTSFEVAGFDLLVFGVLSLWAMAAASHALGEISGTPWRGLSGRAASMPVAFGALVAAASGVVAGLQQGYTWVAGVTSGLYPAWGGGFANSVGPLETYFVLRSVGLGLILVGTAFYGLGVLGRLLRRGVAIQPVALPPTEGPGIRQVLRGAALLFALSLVGALIFPAIDSTRDATLYADEVRALEAGSDAERGRQLYVSEGCWYCHTQQVRQVITDVGLGPVSAAGDYSNDDAELLGVTRFGPDLMHAGSREPTDSVRWLIIHLGDPRADTPEHEGRNWSRMPAFDYLDEADVRALAVYVSGLE